MTSKSTMPSRAPGAHEPSLPKRKPRYHHHLFLYQCNNASNLRTELAEVTAQRVLSKRTKEIGEDA